MTPESVTPYCPHHGCVETSLVRIEQSMENMTAGFEGVNKTLKEVAGDLREGAVTMGEMRVRINLLERATYGGIGIALTGLATAILALVLRS